MLYIIIIRCGCKKRRVVSILVYSRDARVVLRVNIAEKEYGVHVGAEGNCCS